MQTINGTLKAVIDEVEYEVVVKEDINADTLMPPVGSYMDSRVHNREGERETTEEIMKKIKGKSKIVEDEVY